MQAPQALANFRCQTSCKHKECQRHANLGIMDKNECECAQEELSGSTIFLENVIDLSHTLAQIMVICGLHECKAKSAVDIITYAFLHYDLVCYCLDEKPKKRLRKEDIFHELGRKCLMNRVEAHLAYTIIKRGFKAFYYSPQIDETAKDYNGRPSYSDECVYVHAAKKTAESYAQFDGLSCDEQRGVEAKIKVVYKKFYDRMQSRQSKPDHDQCNCCFCAKKRGHLVYGKPPPCVTTKPPKKPHTCPHCCKRKKKAGIVHPQAYVAKCPVCHRSRKYCTCAKYDFGIEWVQSIWNRPDMNIYYQNTIEKPQDDFLPHCRPQGTEWQEEAQEEEEDEEPAAIDENPMEE
uniref:Uncharacterized protein n=1 Tax=Glossina pallidipes TaxID=7398 RepID=A0A1A9ZXV6_GLOPL